MDIKKLFKQKDALEDKVCYINEKIKTRWEKLLGFDCGCFDDWGLSGDIVNVCYVHRGSHGNDEIPIEFFEMPDENKTKEKYKAYIAEKKKEKQAEKEKQEELKEKELYKKLKEKYSS